MGDLVGHSRLVHRGNAVAAAHNRGRGGIVGHGLGDPSRAFAELIELEYAHGAVPYDGARAGDLLGEEFNGCGTDVERHLIGGNRLAFGDHRACGTGVELAGDDVVHRKQQAYMILLGLGDQLGREPHLVGFQHGFAGLLAHGLQEGIGHAAADDERVHLGQQVADYADLVAHLGAAQNRQERLGGVLGGLAQVFEFALHQQAGRVLLQEVGHALGAGVSAVG